MRGTSRAQREVWRHTDLQRWPRVRAAIGLNGVLSEKFHSVLTGGQRLMRAPPNSDKPVNVAVGLNSPLGLLARSAYLP